MSISMISTANFQVVLDLPPVIEVTLDGVGVQGPPGPSPLWQGPTPPDPNMFPLWLDTSP